MFKSSLTTFVGKWLKEKLMDAAPNLLMNLIKLATPVTAGARTVEVAYRMIPCMIYGLKLLFKQCFPALARWMKNAMERYSMDEATRGGFHECENELYEALCGGTWLRGHWGVFASHGSFAGHYSKPNINRIARWRDLVAPGGHLCGMSLAQIQRFCFKNGVISDAKRFLNPYSGQDPQADDATCEFNSEYNAKALFWRGCSSDTGEKRTIQSFFQTCRTQYAEGACQLLEQEEIPVTLQPWFKARQDKLNAKLKELKIKPWTAEDVEAAKRQYEDEMNEQGMTLNVDLRLVKPKTEDPSPYFAKNLKSSAWVARSNEPTSPAFRPGKTEGDFLKLKGWEMQRYHGMDFSFPSSWDMP
jgi:hypothetical protein